jgi:hypothetical protein
MTKAEAEALRVKLKQQVERPPCKHSNLELESNGEGHLTGNYTAKSSSPVDRRRGIVSGDPLEVSK